MTPTRGKSDGFSDDLILSPQEPTHVPLSLVLRMLAEGRSEERKAVTARTTTETEQAVQCGWGGNCDCCRC